MGTALTFLRSDFEKEKALLRSHAHGDSALPRRPLTPQGSGSCGAEWRISWTSALQVLLPDQVWEFALGLHKYVSVLPTTSALSHDSLRTQRATF